MSRGENRFGQRRSSYQKYIPFVMVAILLMAILSFCSACSGSTPNGQSNSANQNGCVSDCSITQNNTSTDSHNVNSTNSASNAPNSSSTTVPTATSVPPTQAPQPVKAGTVLCSPKMSDWPQNSGWQTIDGEYVYTTKGDRMALAPCTISVTDYSVEIVAHIPDNTCGGYISILARVNLENKTGYAGGQICTGGILGDVGLFITDDLTYQPSVDYSLRNVDSGSGTRTSTYKLVVKGSHLQLYFNNALKVEKMLTTANTAGNVGVQCTISCSIVSFKVVAV